MLSEPVRELVAKIGSAEEAHRAAPRGEMLEVSTIVGKAASFYEKLRYLIDYREEHTIRRAALERILKRRVFIELKAESGLVLLQELVDGKYIPKELATEEMAHEIAAKSIKLAVHAGRKTVKAEDIKLAVKD